MNIFFIYIILFFLENSFIDCENIKCFEYSCEECSSEKYGNCTRCRPGFHLIDGTCPCADSSCALCTTGLAGLNICKLCKKGFYRMDDDCHCEVENCDICEENGCFKCSAGYFYNSTDNTCQKYEDNDVNKIKCFNDNCDICFSEEQGACDKCKDGFYFNKGECLESPIPQDKNCKEGFYFTDNFCQQSCQGVQCDRYEIFYYTCPSNKCLVCENNELKVFTVCNNTENCTREGCLNCIDDDYCLICDQGYYLIGGICIKCTYGCSLCSNNETCNYCMSGFKLNAEKKCELNENNNDDDFDFHLKKYRKYKNKLIKNNYPNEVIIEEDTSDIIECSSNCKKCDDYSGKCKECNQLYLLDSDNQCYKHCSKENCVDCYIQYGNERCSKCDEGYYIKADKCVYNCSDPNCISCYLLDGKELCTQCDFNYSLEDLKCKSKTKIMAIISIIVTISLFVTLIVCFCYYRKKLIERRRELMVNGFPNGGLNIIPYNMNPNEIDSSHRAINKEEAIDEFEKLKIKMEKDSPCQFCKKKPGRFQCDCGCIVCKDHSILKNEEKDGQNIKLCFNCGKIVYKVEQIKTDCNVCLQKKINVVHFKCGCSFVVCKDCYLKCRMESNKCPGCRTVIG